MGRKLGWKRNTEASVARKRSQLTTEGDLTCEDRHAGPAASAPCVLHLQSSPRGSCPLVASPPCSKPSDTIARSGLAVPRRLAPPADPASPTCSGPDTALDERLPVPPVRRTCRVFTCSTGAGCPDRGLQRSYPSLKHRSSPIAASRWPADTTGNAYGWNPHS